MNLGDARGSLEPRRIDVLGRHAQCNIAGHRVVDQVDDLRHIADALLPAAQVGRVITVSSTTIRPLEAISRPSITSTVVDFPAPVEPATQVAEPDGIARSTLQRVLSAAG